LKIFNRKFEYYITKFEEKAKIILKRVVYEIILSRTHLGFIPSDKIMTKSTLSLEKNTLSLEKSTLSLEKSTLSLEKSTLSLEKNTLSLEKSTCTLL
jgi:hypothetical protein